MSIHALSRTSRRMIAVGLLAGALALPAAGLAYGASAFVFDQDSHVKEVEEQLASMSSVSGSITQLRRVLATLERDARYSIDLYPPVSDTQASAALQSAVQKAVRKIGAAVRSALPLDVVEEGALRRIGVRVVVTGNTNQFNNALAALDEANPALVVGNAEIRVVSGSRYDDTATKAPDVQATLDVFAYARKE